MTGIDGVILAAGLSSRAGTNKMLLDVGDRTVIEGCILSIYDICSKIIVVTGHRPEEIGGVLGGYPKVQIVHNSDYPEGMFSSVKTGLKYVTGDRFFLTPGDYPAIGGNSCREMTKVEGDIVIPTYNGRRGHPVLMKSSLISQILNGGEYSNLREFIHSKTPIELELQDPGILMDIDTIEDYNSIYSYIQKGVLSKKS